MNLFLYVEESSWLHCADPRSKIFALVVVFFLALGLQGIQPLLLLAGLFSPPDSAPALERDCGASPDCWA